MEQPASRFPFILTGALIGLTLLIKETIILFLPYGLLVTRLFGKRWVHAACILGSFLGVIILLGLGYYHYTGNAFFKFTQIENSAYPNPCNFSYLPLNELLARLTYGTWTAFVSVGFYPFVLGTIALLPALLAQKGFAWKREFELTSFLILLLLSLYFPFSWKDYQPLCAVPRHFYFIIPLGAVVFTTMLHKSVEAPRNRRLVLVFLLFTFVVCLLGTPNKWQWMIYGMMFLYMLLQPVLTKLAGPFQYLAFSAILFLSTLEHLFFHPSHWFKNMQQLKSILHEGYYYFPDHDNMMHWKLLHRFDERFVHSYNIEKHPYKVYQVYYEKPDTVQFQPGWLMVNRVYTTCSPLFLNRVDSLQRAGYFSKWEIRGEIAAYWMDTKSQYLYIRENNFRR